MRKSYKNRWKRRIEQERTNYIILLEDDPFEEWDNFVNHELEIEFYLLNGIELLCGDSLLSEAMGHLMRCQAMCDRAIAEKVYLAGKSKHCHPENHARILRARMYANWFCNGILGKADIAEAGKSMLLWCNRMCGKNWDKFNQGRYISAVMMLLIANDLENLHQALREERACPEWKTVLPEIRAIADSVLTKTAPPDIEDYDGVFDRVRQPNKTDLLIAFEMAVLRALFLTNDADKLPGAAVSALSY